MKSWNAPTPEEVARALALLAVPERNRYFFDRLENPKWVAPLRTKKVFSSPPQPIVNEAEGTVQFPVWWASRWLARMAALAPQEVLETALTIKTENVYIWADLLDIALALPAELSARLVPEAKRWLNSNYRVLIPEKLGKLVVHLAQHGEVQPAGSLASELLDVKAETDAAAGSRRARPRFDPWEYQQIVQKDIPEFVRRTQASGLRLLCEVLNKAIRIRRIQAKGDEDFSSIWCSSVRDAETDAHFSIEPSLVAAIRDSADQLVAAQQLTVAQVLDILSTYKWQIFDRISMYVVSLFPNADVTISERFLLDRHRFDSGERRHEYDLLLHAAFPLLAPSSQKQLLVWVMRPRLARFRTRYKMSTGQEATKEIVEARVRFARRDRLAPIAEYLPKRHQRLYRQLVEQVGGSDFPLSPHRMMTWMGTTSPISAEDLRAKTVSELHELLSTWKPAEAIRIGPEPSVEGLANELSEIVAQEPVRYLDALEQFTDLPPVYVGAIVMGLRNALQAKRQVDWPAVLKFGSFLVEAHFPVRNTDDERDEWTNVFRELVAVLALAFTTETNGAPIDQRQGIWLVLSRLAEHPNPTPAHEATYGGSNMDPVTLAMNTVRGAAVRTAIDYGLWVNRQTDSNASSFEKLPELRQLLEEHVQMERDPSLAIRSVYGEFLPWLVLLDRTWVTGHLDRIFPEENRRHRDAAWEAYVSFCRPYENVVDVLWGEYRTAVRLMGTYDPSVRRLADPDYRLAEHLMMLYWRGQLGIDDALLVDFYVLAPEAVRAHALDFLGRSLANHSDAVPQEVLTRLQTLFQRRFAAAGADAASFKKELAAYGWWFASRKFPAKWALATLLRVLENARMIDPEHLVVEKLAELARAFPALVMDCFAALVAAEGERWRLSVWGEHARTILAIARSSEDPRVVDLARTVADDLGRRGFIDLRDLARPA